MKKDSQEQTEELTEFHKQFTIATSSNEFLFSLFGITFAAVMILGISFFFITLGLIGWLWLMALVFEPAYHLFRKFFRLTNLPLHFVRPPTSRVIFIYIMLVIPGSIIFIGVQGLLGAFGPINIGLIFAILKFFLR